MKPCDDFWEIVVPSLIDPTLFTTGSRSVTNVTTTVSPTDEIVFDEDQFTVIDAGGGEADVTISAIDGGGP